MKGFDTLGPVVTALMPGSFEIASIMLVLKFCCNSFLPKVIIGTGFRVISVVLDVPVTTTSFISVMACSITKFFDDVVARSTFSTIDLYPKKPVSYTHLRAHETRHDLVCRLLLEK